MSESSLYPSALDSSNLYEVVARLSTTLTADIAADTTTIPLASTTGFPTKGYIVIDNETIEYISVSVGSVDATGGRGHAGTAASHTNTTQVLVAVTASVINKLRAGMIAIQTYAGTSGGTQGGINAKYLGGSTESQLNLVTTQTLTNKRVTKREVTDTSNGTPTPNSNITDIYTLTALGGAATFGAPTGTPTQGQTLLIRIKDNGTARALSWNAIYRAGDIALPTTTILSKTMYVGFIYNSTDTKWDLIAYDDNH